MANESFPPWPPDDPEVAAALDAAARDRLWGQYHGPHVAGLEEELAGYFGVPHVLTCASGTLAVEAALRSVGVGPGDEVVLAAYEYESNFLTVHAIGARPVLVDVRPGTATLDPVHLTDAFSPSTKAVVVSHLHGTLADMPAVLAACEPRGIAVVEDAAQSPGAVLGGKKAGAWGHAGVVSFGGSKLLAAGRGGTVFFRDAAAYQRAKVWLSRGVQQWAAISELQAAVLRPQLKRLDERTEQRYRAVSSIVDELEGIPGLTPLQFLGQPGDLPAFYKVGFPLDETGFGLSRDDFCRLVRAEGVAFDPGFKALHLSRAPSRFRALGTLSEAARLHRDCATLHHPVLLGSPEQVSHVARAVRTVYRNRARPA